MPLWQVGGRAVPLRGAACVSSLTQISAGTDGGSSPMPPPVPRRWHFMAWMPLLASAVEPKWRMASWARVEFAALLREHRELAMTVVRQHLFLERPWQNGPERHFNVKSTFPCFAPPAHPDKAFA